MRLRYGKNIKSPDTNFLDNSAPGEANLTKTPSQDENEPASVEANSAPAPSCAEGETVPPEPSERDPHESEDGELPDEVGHMAEIDRDVPVVCRELGKTFPAPSRYDHEDWMSSFELIAQAPWFDRSALDRGDVIRHYVADGWLPGGVPFEATETWAWMNQFACYDEDLFVGYNRTLEGVRYDFATQAMNGFDRIQTYTRCDPASSGMFLVRTRGESDYFDRLVAIPDARIESWRGREIVSNDAWVWPRAQLCAEFRFIRKRGAYWRTFVKNTRRLRAKHGRAIPYQCLATFNLAPEFFRRAFCELTRFWSRIECPRGCNVELPMVFTYKMRELMDPDSGWWVVAYTEMAVKTACFVLMDVYDNYRLWSLSPHMIDCMKQLDLSVSLGNAASVADFTRLLDVIEGTKFSESPSAWTLRGDVEQNASSTRSRRGWGRQGGGADFVYYDPWNRTKISSEQAQVLLRGERRPIPDGHPVGWDHSAIPDGWALSRAESAEAVTAEEIAETGWEGDVPAESAEGGATSAPSANPPVAPASNVTAAPAGVVPASTAQVQGMRLLLETLGGVPEAVLNSNNPLVMSAYLQGRMHSPSGAAPGGENSS